MKKQTTIPWCRRHNQAITDHLKKVVRPQCIKDEMGCSGCNSQTIKVLMINCWWVGLTQTVVYILKKAPKIDVFLA
ncbi:MAG: hypothetical protein GY729_04670 [Desulfobacteraceae bacterium]|nr:hypothetical protein [Desulfobacteraceae bacterium]